MKFKLSHKVLVVVSLPVVFQLGYLAFLTSCFNKLAESQSAEQTHTQILLLRDRLDMDFTQSSVMNSIYRATTNPLYRNKSLQSAADLENTCRVLSNLLDGPKKTMLNQLWHRFQVGIRTVLTVPAFERQERIGGPEGMDPRLLKGMSKWSNYQLDYVETSLRTIFAEEQASQLETERRINQLRDTLQTILFLGLGASLFVALASALFFSSSVSSRLKLILLNIKSMEAGTFELQSAGGSDEIANLDQAIRRTAKEIQDAEQFQAHTVEIVADELERPLASLSTNFAALKLHGFEELSEKGNLRLERTDQEIGRLRRLVNELALINTVKTARLELQIREIDLADTARSAIDIVADLARSKNVRLSYNPASVMVFADQHRVLQVVVNLLSNAIKFSAPNTLVLIETAHPANNGRLSVTDQGPGISDAFRSKIFTNFEQAHSSDAMEEKGTGLGLAISKNIIEQHRGQMGFDTKLGEGSTFWLTLPTNRPDEVVPASTGIVAKSKSWQSTYWKKGLVLIALPLLVNLITFCMLSLVLNSMNENINEFRHAQKIASLAGNLIEDLFRGLQSAFMFNVARVENDRKSAMLRRQAVETTFAQLDSLLSEKDGLSSKGRLGNLLDEMLAFQDEVLSAPPNERLDRWFGEKTAAKTESLVLETERPIQEVMRHEQEMMEASTLSSQDTRNLLNYVLVSSAVLSGLVSAGLALFMAGRLSKRINLVVDNTIRLAHRAPLDSPLQGNDELAFVDQALYDAANKLVELEQTRQEMVAVSSHELRTPLTSLSVLSELVAAGSFGNLTAEGTKLVADAKETTDDLISMITNLLDLEKMQSGKILVHKERSQLDGILKRAVSNLAPLAEKCQVELRVDNAKHEAEVDPNRITQALISILREFVEELPNNSVISLSCPRDKYGVAIKISAPNAREGNSHTSRNPHAARQRLAIDLTKLIAEQHGGQLQIRSSQDRRVVTILLPSAKSGSAA